VTENNLVGRRVAWLKVLRFGKGCAAILLFVAVVCLIAAFGNAVVSLMGNNRPSAEVENMAIFLWCFCGGLSVLSMAITMFVGWLLIGELDKLREEVKRLAGGQQDNQAPAPDSTTSGGLSSGKE